MKQFRESFHGNRDRKNCPYARKNCHKDRNALKMKEADPKVCFSLFPTSKIIVFEGDEKDTTTSWRPRAFATASTAGAIDAARDLFERQAAVNDGVVSAVGGLLIEETYRAIALAHHSAVGRAEAAHFVGAAPSPGQRGGRGIV